MAAVTAPSGQSLLGKVASAFAGRAAVRKQAASKVAAAITDHTGTFTALGFMATAAWHEGPFWGWLATGVAVLVAEFKVRG